MRIRTISLGEKRKRTFTLLAMLFVVIVSGCAPKATPPGADVAAGVVGQQVGFEFLRWEEGLAIMIWHDFLGNSGTSSTSESSGFTTDPIHRLQGYAESWDGHRFSLRHPPGFDVPPADLNEPRGSIGDQIVFSVAEQDPYWLGCLFEGLGGCPVMEQIEWTRVGDPTRNAIRISGFIGSIGGRIPQQYVTYLMREGGMYYTFTLYASGRDSEVERVDVIWPLGEADIVAFEQMMETLTFQVGNRG
jgi:hypothetical protein